MKFVVHDRGAILLIILILLVVITLVGISTLGTTNLGIKQISSYRSRQSLENVAETGLAAGHLRLKTLWENLGASGGAMDRTDLLAICTPTAGTSICTTPNPTCAKGNPTDSDKDAITQNIICNFLGTSFSGGRVVLIRQNDLADGLSTYAQFIINSIASDSSGRRRILQSGFIAKYVVGGVPTINTSKPVELIARRWLNN